MAALRRVGAYLKRLVTHGKPVSGRDLQFRSETLLVHTYAVGSGFVLGRTLPDALSRCAEAVLADGDEHASFEEQVNSVKNYLLVSTVATLRSVRELHAKGERDLHEGLKAHHGFVPVVRKSGVPGAGDGLFIDGRAKAGTLLALYPGICYLPSDFYRLPDCLEFVQRNEYLMWRYDGVVIDGAVAVGCDEPAVDSDNDAAVPDDVGEAAQDDASKGATGAAPSVELIMHPFSNGHRANHAPKGKAPNCLQFHMNFPVTRNTAALRPYVPNSMYPMSRRTMLDSVMNTSIHQKVKSVSQFGVITGAPNLVPTLVFLATQDIQDEEVFINYRYNPNGPQCPSWYHDCDPESTARRWAAGDKVFFTS